MTPVTATATPTKTIKDAFTAKGDFIWQDRTNWPLLKGAAYADERFNLPKGAFFSALRVRTGEARDRALLFLTPQLYTRFGLSKFVEKDAKGGGNNGGGLGGLADKFSVSVVFRKGPKTRSQAEVDLFQEFLKYVDEVLLKVVMDTRGDPKRSFYNRDAKGNEVSDEVMQACMNTLVKERPDSPLSFSASVKPTPEGVITTEFYDANSNSVTINDVLAPVGGRRPGWVGMRLNVTGMFKVGSSGSPGLKVSAMRFEDAPDIQTCSISFSGDNDPVQESAQDQAPQDPLADPGAGFFVEENVETSQPESLFHLRKRAAREVKVDV